MRQKWDGLDEFVAVAMSTSFVGGAAKLGCSTSQVSRAITRLETYLQTQLFYRTTRTVTLTETGRALLERSRTVLQARDEALDFAAGGEAPQGELRLTCSTAIGTRFIAPIVAQMMHDYPRLSIHLELTNSLVDLVAQGYDLAVRTGQLSDSRLVATRVAARRLYLCAAPVYLGARETPMQIDDLVHHDCLVGNAATWLFEADGAARIFRPHGRWRCNSGDAVLRAALTGLGICQLPEFYVLPHIASGELVPLLAPFRPADEPIWAITPQRRHILPKVQELIERLRRDLGPRLNART